MQKIQRKAVFEFIYVNHNLIQIRQTLEKSYLTYTYYQK